MNYHQSIDEIIKAASPEQRIIWNALFLKFGENISVSQFYYTGGYNPIFTVYDARRLYFFYYVRQSLLAGAGIDQALALTNNYYDENNNGFDGPVNDIAYYNTTAAAVRYRYNHIEVKNVIFSRIVTDYTYIHCVGFKLGI
jgi:hypothetical protein